MLRIISSLLSLSTKKRIPGPTLPPLFIIKDMVLNCFLTAIVAYAINFSLADIFAKQHKYKINPSQEFFANGISNIFASFFPCFCSGSSFARSCVQNDAGGKTQVMYCSRINKFFFLNIFKFCFFILIDSVSSIVHYFGRALMLYCALF